MEKIGIYFSIFGNNKRIASELAEKDNYELIEFAPGTIFRVFQFFWGKKKLAKKARKLKPEIEDFNNILIHGPIWAGKPAPAIRKLIENLNLTGKNISCHFTYTQDYRDTEQMVREMISNRNARINEIKFTKISEKNNKKK
jgi:hypothetical protein